MLEEIIRFFLVLLNPFCTFLLCWTLKLSRIKNIFFSEYCTKPLKNVINISYFKVFSYSMNLSLPLFKTVETIFMENLFDRLITTGVFS